MPLDHSLFPYAQSEGYTEKSLWDKNYNCIAWAAGDVSHNWWPNQYGYWPIPQREETIDCFVQAFKSLGYQECSTSNHEAGYERIAIYAQHGIPKHAARQLENGNWTSKIGRNIDVEHPSLRAVEGLFYGQAVAFLRRKLNSQ